MTNTKPSLTTTAHLTALARIKVKRDRLAAAVETLDGAQFAAVLDARLAGASWAQIGAALGVSAQAVQKRYAPTSTRA